MYFPVKYPQELNYYNHCTATIHQLIKLLHMHVDKVKYILKWAWLVLVLYVLLYACSLSVPAIPVHPSGTQSSDYLSQIPPSPAFATMLPQIAPSPASRQPTAPQPTLLGPSISRHHQLSPSAIPTTQPTGQPPTHLSSTDSKKASLEGIISTCIQTVY